MALKDWKKDIAGEGKYFRMFFDNKNAINEAGEKVEFTLDISLEKRKYVVRVLYDEEIDKVEKFKTKSQALKFAKSYMRKH